MLTYLIVAIGLTFFPGQPHWYELDTSGIEWIVQQVHEVEDEVLALSTPVTEAP